MKAAANNKKVWTKPEVKSLSIKENTLSGRRSGYRETRSRRIAS